jgi:hypothetical protein
MKGRTFGLVIAGVALCALAAFPGQAAGPGTLEACKQSFNYTISDPAPSLPADSKAFSGVWVGHFNLICAALIVQSIDEGGTASTIYAYATQSWQPIAKVNGKKLTFGTTQPIVFTVDGPNSLSAVHTGPGGTTAGSFSRK